MSIAVFPPIEESTAARSVDGVETAIQYSIPVGEAVKKARLGEGATLSTRDKHLRECFIVAKEDADKAIASLKEEGEEACILGEVVAGNKEVIIV